MYSAMKAMHFSDINVLFLCMVLFIWAPPIESEDVGYHHEDIGFNADDVGYKADAVGYNAFDFGYNAYDAGYEKSGYMTCICGTSMQVMNKNLEVKIAENIFNEVSNSIPTDRNFTLHPDSIDTKDCKSCEVGFYICNSENRNCIKRMVEFEMVPKLGDETLKNNFKVISKRSIQVIPKTIDIPIGGLKNNKRQVRQTVGCSYPSALQTAAFTCKIFPHHIKCDQRCAFGYTLENGIRQEMQCKFKENKWTPSGFKECQPFVDCAISLISGGSTNCTTMGLKQGPECKIECLHYEDKPTVPETSYFCTIDGKWDPPLPFCVVTQSGLALVKAPKIKLHDDNDELDFYSYQ